MSHAALVQEEGIASLYKGIRPTLLGIMPYASWQEADVTDRDMCSRQSQQQMHQIGRSWMETEHI